MIGNSAMPVKQSNRSEEMKSHFVQSRVNQNTSNKTHEVQNVFPNDQIQDALLRSDLTSLETSHDSSNARQAAIRVDLDSLSAVMDDTRNAYATKAEVLMKSSPREPI